MGRTRLKYSHLRFHPEAQGLLAHPVLTGHPDLKEIQVTQGLLDLREQPPVLEHQLFLPAHLL